MSAAARIKSFIERIETLETEKGVVAAGIKEVYAEAKSDGFDTKALKAVITLRKMDPSEREHLEGVIDTYMAAIGMTPADEEEE